LLQALRVEFAADEHQPAFMLLAVLPRALVVAFDDHVHALYDVAVRVVPEGDDALEAQDIRAFELGDLLDPREELLRVHLAAAQRYGLHRHVVDRRDVVVMVVMMGLMSMMIMPVMIVVMMVMVAIR